MPSSWAYVWRQGLANLYRPNNQTVILMLALGLGIFLVLTLSLTHGMLLQQVALSADDNKPNLVLFDIQTDQQEEVATLVRSFDLPVLQQVPIVTMRLAAIKGRRVEALRHDPSSSIPDWALRWEYRATYREHLIATETVIADAWQGRADPVKEAVAVSLEEKIARTLGVTLRDELVFDVQSVPLTVTVGSLRTVDWRQVQPNFFVVFPVGVLEAAPQFYVLISRTEANDVSALLQRSVVQQFPNVSALDLTLILQTVDAILDKISFALRFMALFSVATGLVVLASAVIASRYQRLQESVLLRTLGAARAQIRNIILIEYLFLGGFAACTGFILALVGSWGLAYFFFRTAFVPPVLPTLGILFVMIGLIVLTGMLGNRSICARSPLDVLRNDG